MQTSEVEAVNMARKLDHRRIGAVAAGAAVALAAVAAAAFAAESSSSSATISACTKNNTGALRVVSARARCKRGERKLTWSSKLPAPSRTAYEVTRAEGPLNVIHDAATFPPTPLTTVATLSKIPPGAYVITAVTNVKNPGWSGVCTLTAGSQKDTGEFEEAAGYSAGVNVTTQLLHTFTTTGDATLACATAGKEATDEWSARNTSIVAVPEAAVSTSTTSG